jgi:hypothetical protein
MLTGLTLSFTFQGFHPRTEDTIRTLLKYNLALLGPTARYCTEQLMQDRKQLTEKLRKAAKAERRYTNKCTHLQKYAIGNHI